MSERLRQLREARRLTVREFAARIGKSPGYVSRVEGRGEIPSAELLCVIAGVYGIEPDELLGLAKQSQLERAERDIDAKHASALALYRKEQT
ncbi:MAG: helix-turn-helix transcriptional regulator [Planctomycetota bacterium]|nr:helix-turn-helix transcriptional regulator [Planctomycetota bacterium]